ncbi:MAG: glycosyltransferase family 4 protein [Desulfobacteraceae bacterium]|nr:glycosyltransferase family 4 protein [Desulfobacteraceae bacterium]
MKIYVIGTRGFPNIQGGVEKHCESLYPVISNRGHFVKVFRRTPYLTANHSPRFDCIQFQDLWTIKNKYFETILHSVLAAFICIYKRPDVVHIHNIGPALILPLLKLFNIKTVVTYHSPNYLHSKWNKFAQFMLKTGERLVEVLSDTIIFVSEIQKNLSGGKNTEFIPNGVDNHTRSLHSDYLEQIGVSENKYLLAVGRFSQEKGLDLLVKAFQAIETDYKLVIAGDADHETEYGKSLKHMIDKDYRLIRTGYITGEPLNQLYSHARLFVLPSFHEGLPIALLEAMSYGLSVLVSDIPANLEVDLSKDRFFKCGDINDLKIKIGKLLDKDISEKEKNSFLLQIKKKYNWNTIAEQTIRVYEKTIAN